MSNSTEKSHRGSKGILSLVRIRKKNSHANQKAAWSDGISDTVLLLGEIERLKAEGISCSQSVQQACEESMLRPGGENSF